MEDEACMMHRLPEAHSMPHWHAATNSARNATCNDNGHHAACRMHHVPCDVRRAPCITQQCSMQHATALGQLRPPACSIYMAEGEGTAFGLLLWLPVSGCGCVRRCKHRQLTLRGGSQLRNTNASDGGRRATRMRARVRIGVPSAPTARDGAPRSDAAAKARQS